VDGASGEEAEVAQGADEAEFSSGGYQGKHPLDQYRQLEEAGRAHEGGDAGGEDVQRDGLE